MRTIKDITLDLSYFLYYSNNINFRSLSFHSNINKFKRDKSIPGKFLIRPNENTQFKINSWEKIAILLTTMKSNVVQQLKTVNNIVLERLNNKLIINVSSQLINSTRNIKKIDKEMCLTCLRVVRPLWAHCAALGSCTGGATPAAPTRPPPPTSQIKSGVSHNSSRLWSDLKGKEDTLARKRNPSVRFRHIKRTHKQSAPFFIYVERPGWLILKLWPTASKRLLSLRRFVNNGPTTNK